MKKYKNSMVMGKFYPFHNGHKLLIDTAIKNSEIVHIFICHKKYDLIKGIDRITPIRNTYFNNPNVIIHDILHNFDDYPGEIESTVEEFYDFWVNKIIYKHVKELDAVFTSESYGDEFAEYLNVEHFQINRTDIPISGTIIRENPLKYWDYLPDETKKLFTKRIVFLGPESSGKTTISKKISEILDTTYVEEYGATYFNIKDLNKKSKNSDNFNIMDINHIASGQIYLEEESIKENKPIIIHDTDLMTTQIWSELYFNDCPKWIIDESYRRIYDIYFLMDIDFEWIDNGTREFPEKRECHFNRIKNELEKRGIKYHLISGDIDERIKKTLKIINII